MEYGYFYGKTDFLQWNSMLIYKNPSIKNTRTSKCKAATGYLSLQ